jgi:hypothetical protein
MTRRGFFQESHELFERLSAEQIWVMPGGLHEFVDF